MVIKCESGEKSSTHYSRLVLVRTTKDGEDQVWMQELDNGNLMFPGGAVEPPEDPLDTLRREVFEETAVTAYTAKDLMMTCLWDAYYFGVCDYRRSAVDYFFTLAGSDYSDILKLGMDPEIKGGSWYSIRDLLENHNDSIYPNIKYFLEHLLKNLDLVYQMKLPLYY